MINVTEHQATGEIAKQKHALEQETDKIGIDGKLFPCADDNVSAATKATTTKTTNDTNAKSASASSTIQYDVEHLATFSTASSHEQQVGAAPTTTATSASASAPTTTTSTNNGDTREETSKVKLKQAATNDSSSIREPREALQKLFELEKLSGIWTQRMQIQLQEDFMLIVDCETDSTVERFHKDRVTRPEAFNHYNDIYNNIIVFNIDQLVGNEREETTGSGKQNEECARTSGELHIFQCVSHKAKQLVSDILAWKRNEAACEINASEVGCEKENKISTKPTDASQGGSLPSGEATDRSQEASKMSSKSRSQESRREDDTTTASAALTADSDNSSKPVVTVGSSSKAGETVPLVNVNVKETVQVFNQIAALREKSSSIVQAPRPLSDASSSSQTGSSSSQQLSQSAAPSEFSRAPLGFNGQSYKQRSIRATLAPKVAPEISKEQSGSQDRPTSSSSSFATSTAEQNNNNVATKPAASSSSSSQSDHHNQHHHHNSSREQSLGQASSMAAVAVKANAATNNNNHEGKAQQPANQKQTTGHSNGSPTQLGSSGHHHNHNHRQQPLVKGKSSSNKLASASSRLPATNGHPHQSQHGNSLGIQSSNSSGRSHGSPPLHQQPHLQQPVDQVTSNESYVSVLNHCFDDIEKFILRIQHAYAAMRMLQAKKRQTKRSSTLAANQSNRSHPGGPLPPLPPPISASEQSMLSAQARGPSADDYFEILSKFKLAFNLLAKLKGCIHEPNAPELVHFLFTPLAIIIESARNVTPPVDPTVVGIPYLNSDALDLLSNCCTSKESDLWLSLGPNWTETIDAKLLKAARLPSSFQPIFSDGWAPVISELELIGLIQAADLQTLPAENGMISKAKRVSPSDVISSRYADPVQVGYLQRSDVMLEAPLPGTDINYPMGEYRVPEMPMNFHSNHAHKSSRHSMPMNERSVRSTTKHSAHGSGSGSGSRRSSEYLDHGQYPSSSLLDSNINELKQDHMNSRYYSTNPSDDYTELQNNGNSYAPGPSALYADGLQAAVSNQSRRKASKSSYNRKYVAEADYEQHGHDLMVHEVEREAMLVDLGPAQTEWFYELKLRGALIVRVLFSREANNDKELTVKRGEVLEILDDTRKWWKARNIDLQVAFVPHTIVAIMEHYQTLDELLTGSSSDMMMMMNGDQTLVNSRRYAIREPQDDESDFPGHQYQGFVEDRRNPKTAKGAFRYF